MPLKSQRVLGAAALVAGLIAATPVAAETDPTFGLWLVEAGSAIIDIGPCKADAAKACGAIVWLKDPVDKAGKPYLDANNPEAGLQSRPICGLDMVYGFTKDGAGKWSGGKIYDPNEGKTYSAKMKTDGADKLALRGFVGISLIGQTQTWTRVADNRGGC